LLALCAQEINAYERHPGFIAQVDTKRKVNMNMQDPNGQPVAAGQTVDLQGVRSFAALVDLLAQELGTTPGKMQGNLPSGPNTFNELVGEIDVNNQGFFRRLTLLSRPGSPFTLRFQVSWADQRRGENAIAGGVTSDYYLGLTVEQIIPQGRALARHVEDIFSVMDRMVSLGQSSRLASMEISAAELQAFEQAEGDNLLRQHRRETFTP
jgi:hypothetical protein